MSRSSRDGWRWMLLCFALSAGAIQAAPTAAPPRLPPELVAARVLIAQATALLKEDAGQLWGRPFDEPSWMLVFRSTAYLSRAPEAAGYIASGGFWTGPLPPELGSANATVEWSGRRWAMVRLPLPEDKREAVALLLHELAHLAQPELIPAQPQSEATGRGKGLLDEPDGRTWLRLEMQALAEALGATGDEEAEALHAALLFRARRYRSAPEEERARERALDLHEGLPEYTARRLLKTPVGQLAQKLTKEALQVPSLVRWFPYATGPAYATLLDRRLPNWKAKLKETPDLQHLAAQTLPDAAKLLEMLDTPEKSATLEKETNLLGETYDLAKVLSFEKKRWKLKDARLSALRKSFVDGPTLRLPLASVTFDPRRQEPLDDESSFYRPLGWKAIDGGELRAPLGALVTSNDVRVRLAPSTKMVEGPLEKPSRWSGEGWVLKLPAGWSFRKEGASWRAVAPPSSDPAP